MEFLSSFSNFDFAYSAMVTAEKGSRIISDERIDSFSSLPEPIIHQIMSFLPAKEVARIPILSKPFKQLWSSFPMIVFDKNSSSKKIFDADKFLDYAKGSIQLRQLNTDLQIFRLQVDLKEARADSRVDGMIGFALENNVQELDLEILVTKEILNYKLIKGFSSRSLTKLNLNGFEFNINSLISSCPLLKILILTECTISNYETNNNVSHGYLTLLSFTRVNITDRWIEKHVPMFSNLEILSLSCCDELRNLRIVNENLERLKVIDSFLKLKTIEVIAPKIRSLHLGTNKCVTDKWLKDQVSSLSYLENLKLQNCRKLENIEIYSDSLKSLELLGFRNIDKVSIDATQLVSFVYSGNISAFKLMNSPRLRNPELKLAGCSNIGIQACKLLRDSLLSFSHCEALTLKCYSNKDLIFCEDVRASMLPPLYDVKHLKIIICGWEEINTNLVDNLLWLSPHPEILTLVPASGIEKIIKFHYKKETESEDFYCCGFPLKCWRDDLERVELQNFEAADDPDQFLRYFGRSAESLEEKICNISVN